MKRAYLKLCHEKRRKKKSGHTWVQAGSFLPCTHFLRPGRMVGTRFFSITKRESFSFFFKNSSSKCFFFFHKWTRFSSRVIILNRGSMPRKRTGRIATPQRDISVTSLETARSLANGNSWVGGCRGTMHVFCLPREWNCSVSYLYFVYLTSLWTELNGGENSLHWKANMLPLFSMMTLCLQAMHILSVQKSNPISLQILIGW